MDLNVRQRYQSPSELLADLNIMQQRLSEGESLEGATLGVKQRTLMVVEANPKIQDMLRTQLKQSGYRVLITENPQRPLSGFSGMPSPPDCVMFSTSNLGPSALEAYNRFVEDASTGRIPAVLLLGSKHGPWAAKAKTSPIHAVVSSPFTLQQLRDILSRILAAAEASAAK